MKTIHTIICTGIVLALSFGSLNAEKPTIKLKIINTQGVSFEFLSKQEAEVEETLAFDTKAIKESIVTANGGSLLYNPIDITRFIKPESEIEDLNFDTSAIFKEITGQVSQSK
jgi:hypothetical protein